MNDKMHFIEQLAQKLKQSEAVAQRAEADAREAAKSMATESEKKEDGRAVLEFGSLAKGQAQRTRKAQEELKSLAAFSRAPVPQFSRKSPIALGAVVDVSTVDEDGKSQERTYIILPVGAGAELVGPGGDGFIQVITPASPVGRALMGRRMGDSFEIVLNDRASEWTILEVN